MVRLHSDRIELRPISRSDAPFIQSLYASPDVTRTLLRIQEPLSSVEAHSFCEAVSIPSGEHRFVAAFRSNGEPVGLGTVHVHAAAAHLASIGYSVLPIVWGQGIGTEVAALLLDFAFGTLGVSEARATTLEENAASARVLEKLGFTVLEPAATETDSRGFRRHVVRWSRRRTV